MGNGESSGGQGSDQREETVESSDTAMKAACALGAVATGAALIYGLSSAAQSDDEKMMKPPGGNGELIPRATFEKDPKSYFQDLRRKGK